SCHDADSVFRGPSSPSSSALRPRIRSGVSVELNASGALKLGMAGWLSADPTKSGAYGAPSDPPVPMFGAQNTGSPTHLISQTYDATFFSLGRTLANTDPMYGESCAAPACPARLLCMASKWLLMLPGCVIDRMSAKCLVSLAIRGWSSLMRIPGTAVAIG